MTNDERVQSLKRFGYTDREAAFLCHAALHSGYFLRRQFLYFIGKCRGQIVADFIERAISLGHAKAYTFRADRTVYHLASRPLYAALGEPDNRHRRTHQTLTIKSRLMALDFILQTQPARFLSTEEEKLSYFCAEVGLAKDCLPVARYSSAETRSVTERYFVDKLPIYTLPDVPASEPVVHFCYIDEGLHSTSGFERYLDQYARLFSQLGRFRVIYISCFPDQFERAQRLFTRRSQAIASPAADPQIGHLLAHFRDRAAFERKDFSGITQAKLSEYREAREAFSGQKYDALFERWKTEGDFVIASTLGAQTSSSFHQNGELRTYRLAFQYELFGTIANGNGKGAA